MWRTKLTECVARCTDRSTKASELEELIDRGSQVTFKTFFRHVSLEAVSDLLGYAYGRSTGPGLHLRNDWHVRFYKSKFRGRPCWYLDWSAIEHVFQ